ncbi:MAG: alpha/beta hydrolase [Actinobacteria bacterium]|nr:alpha/beta hydrolase [Actinomycetota bacterium]MBI3686542.1 alpha/beta hydrolase [Actinomycetota bacterium]
MTSAAPPEVSQRSAALARARTRRAVRRLTVLTGPDPISERRSIRLGGAEHTLLIRGTDRSNPVLLYVHGFMDPAIPSARELGWVSGLEERYVVVCWERRGYGSAFRRGLDPAGMTVDQAVNDGVELVEELQTRFGVEALHLVGHSLGAVIALRLALRRPEQVATLTCLAPVIDNGRADLIVAERLAEAARHSARPSLARRVRRLGAPPYPASRALRRVDVVARSGGIYADRRAGLPRLVAELLWRAARTPEYRLRDIVRLAAMTSFVVNSSWDDLFGINLVEQVDSIPVPVRFIVGARDNGAPPDLVEEFVTGVAMPAGGSLLRVSRAAHFVHVERPDLIDPATIDRSHAPGPEVRS